MKQLESTGITRRRLLMGGLASMSLASGLGEAYAQAFPAKSISLVVAYAPGGSTDVVSRLLAQELSPALKQSVVVENKAGGGTVIGTQFVQKAPADGHTLLFGTNAFVITSQLTKPAPWDPLRDFEPVTLVTQQALGVLVRSGMNVNSISELIAYAKANPGKVNFASSGSGSAQHLAGEAFRTAAGIEMLHIPYKGAGPALQDLVGGQVDVMFTSLVGIAPYLATKKAVVIATTGSKRNPATPEIPTVAESGVPGLAGFEAISWQAVFAPAKTPRAVIDRLHAEMVKIGKAGGLTKQLAEQGMELRMGSADELRKVVAHERDNFIQVAKTVKFE